jgi:hypothetical protein
LTVSLGDNDEGEIVKKLIIALVMVVCSFGTVYAQLNSVEEIEATTWAMEFVKQSLKSPTTAKFQSAPDFCVAPLKDKKGNRLNHAWEVSGYVDSQNSYGAMMRTNWNVKLKNNGSSWQLLKKIQFWQ